MKQRLTALIVSALALVVLTVGFWFLEQHCEAPVPVPSVSSGYYDEEFILHLTAPKNGTIYYTTDGSTPTTQSAVYTEGIPIVNRSSEPNIYKAVQNVVSDWKTYTPDPTPVEKGTVVRAIYVSDWGLVSDILTQTYFVGIPQPEQGYTLSLVFEYDDLFGEDGIYVTGKEYDDWYLSGGDPAQAPLPNFMKDMEAVTIAEWMDSEGDILNQPVGLRIQGNTSRIFPSKRLTITAREEYGGSQFFDAPLFPGVITHSVMLKDSLPDAMMADLLQDRSVSTQQCIPVRVYLNGEFLYSTYMFERYDSQYFRQYYQVADRILVKDGIPDEESLALSEIDYYGEYMYWIKHTDFSAPAQWAQLQEETDVQSYIDYIITNYYMCNYDFSEAHNYVLWRSCWEGSGPYDDLRWRWCIYDIDVLLGIIYNENIDDPAALNLFSNAPVHHINILTVFSALRANEEFCRQFVLSFQDMVNNNFAPERVEAVLKKYGYTLDWRDGYFRRRPAFAMQHLAEEFNLTGTLETVQITSAHPEMGTVTVNTSQIDLSGGSWTGQYYTDYPITITATPEPGYTFVGWKGDTGETSTQITLPVTGGISLEAVFAEA